MHNCSNAHLFSLFSRFLIIWKIMLIIVGQSEWDDGRWEWEDTPRRETHSYSNRRYQPSPSPMYFGTSPDARLVSPWLGGGQTPSGMLNDTRPSPYPQKSCSYPTFLPDRCDIHIPVPYPIVSWVWVKQTH